MSVLSYLLDFDAQLFGVVVVAVYYWIQSSKEDENVLLKHILRKCHIFVDSVLFMILSKDSKGVGQKKNADPDRMVTQKLPVLRSKTMIFIRHGESDWNDVFNKGINPGMIVRLCKAMYFELMNFASLNSTFIDSPLNLDGIEQAVELSKFIQNPSSTAGQTEQVAKYLRILRGDVSDSSVIVSSSLRRAIATTTVGLWPRVYKTGEKIHILSSLQEMSRNIDTYALSPAHSVADLPFDRVAPHCGKEEFNPEKIFDTTANFGNKSYEFYGIKRLRAFNEWAFLRSEETIVVGGHSLWFKYFFQTFLPHSCTHESKNKKIQNSGAIAFKIEEFTDPSDGVNYFRVDPESIVTVYGGFTTK